MFFGWKSKQQDNKAQKKQQQQIPQDISLATIKQAKSKNEILEKVKSLASINELAYVDDGVFEDIATILWNEKTYQVQITTYYDKNDNVNSSAIQIFGLMKMEYKKKVYYTPMKVIIPVLYPYVPPLIFVEPAANMKVSPKCHILSQDDNSVKISELPCLKKNTHQIPAINTILKDISAQFGKTPPLYTMSDAEMKQQQQQRQQQQKPGSDIIIKPVQNNNNQKHNVSNLYNNNKQSTPPTTILPGKQREDVLKKLIPKLDKLLQNQYETLVKDTDHANQTKQQLHTDFFRLRHYELQILPTQIQYFQNLSHALDKDISNLEEMIDKELQIEKQKDIETPSQNLNPIDESDNIETPFQNENKPEFDLEDHNPLADNNNEHNSNIKPPTSPLVIQFIERYGAGDIKSILAQHQEIHVDSISQQLLRENALNNTYLDILQQLEILFTEEKNIMNVIQYMQLVRYYSKKQYYSQQLVKKILSRQQQRQHKK